MGSGQLPRSWFGSYPEAGKMREHGIGAVTWPGPELPQEVADRQVDFPVTNSLNETLVMLPIHQSLNDDDMVAMIGLLKKWITV